MASKRMAWVLGFLVFFCLVVLCGTLSVAIQQNRILKAQNIRFARAICTLSENNDVLRAIIAKKQKTPEFNMKTSEKGI